MDSQQRTISELIRQTRTRIRARRALRGVLITLVIAGTAFTAAALAAPPFSHRPGVLILLRILPAALVLGATWLFILIPVSREIPDLRIARLVEERCGLADRLVTTVECSNDPRGASPVIVARLNGDASSRCATVDLDSVVNPRHAFAYAAGAVLILLVATPLFFVGPAPISGGMTALYSPGAPVSADAAFVRVSPGSVRVPRGSDQKIKATLSGFDSEIVQVFMRRLDTPGWMGNRMEPAKSQAEFQYVVFNIQESVAYYVEAAGIRSPEFTLEVADLPFVKTIDLVLDFPAHTRLASKRIENGGEVVALKGTVVTATAHLSAKAKSARIVMKDGSQIEMDGADGYQFTGRFTVKQNGSYRIEITSQEGERYNGSNEYDVTVVEDHAPVVVIDKPGRDMKVTSVQEVFTQARAEDDYGVASIALYYSVNGGEERRVQLQDLKADSQRTLSGAHTFFLEEYGLKPGDFVSYYAKARDNSEGGGQESTSDIYFLEVRPFDRQFRQAQQQGGAGGEQDSNALTRRQREIIAATFRVQREQQRYTPQEAEENFGAVTLSQERLRGDAESLAERIRRRVGDQLGAQPDFAKLIEYLSQASKEMGTAAGELKSRKPKEALPPEQRALQQLLRAEAVFRDIQVARGGQGGQSRNDSAQELADLFELQLDKMKNQYETVQREQQTDQSQKEDEIARRLQELARRQQQQLEQQVRSQQQGGQGGGGGGSQRQQQEMIDEARRMARELEKLSRDRRDPKLQETARQLQQAADEMQRAQALSSSSNSAQATAQTSRALERLEQARRTLESAQRTGGQQSVQRLRQRAEEALKRQDEIARTLDEIARSGGASPNARQGDSRGQPGREGGTSEEKKRLLAERKQALADEITGLEGDIDQAARGLDSERHQAGDSLREAAGAIRRNRLPDRIRQNNQLIENGWYDQARDRERIIRGNIEDVVRNLQAAEGHSARRTEGESLEEALNRARELADNLESLRRRIESERNQDRGQQGPGQQNQPGQRSGQQGGGEQQATRQSRSGQQSSGQRSQSGQQQSGQAGGQQSSEQSRGFASDPGDDITLRGGGPLRGSRQLESELRQRLNEAEELRRQLGRNSDLARDLNRAIEQLRRIDPNAFSDPAQLALLKSEVIDPLRQLELELARRLQARLGAGSPGVLGEGEAPDRYRRKIEDYYRRLSKGRVQN